MTNKVEVCKAKAKALFNEGIEITIEYVKVSENKLLWKSVLDNSTHISCQQFTEYLHYKTCEDKRVMFFVDECYTVH